MEWEVLEGLKWARNYSKGLAMEVVVLELIFSQFNGGLCGTFFFPILHYAE